MHGPVYQSAFIPEVNVISITTETIDGNPFGQVQNGELIPRGLCLPAIFKEDKLIPLTNRMTYKHDIEPFYIYSSWDNAWYPGSKRTFPPDRQILMMLIGFWPRDKTQWTEAAAHESWFLAFECVDPILQIYKRIGLHWTGRLAYRARFLRHTLEQTLTII
jgi:hypothetical protein